MQWNSEKGCLRGATNELVMVTSIEIGLRNMCNFNCLQPLFDVTLDVRTLKTATADSHHKWDTNKCFASQTCDNIQTHSGGKDGVARRQHDWARRCRRPCRRCCKQYKRYIFTKANYLFSDANDIDKVYSPKTTGWLNFVPLSGALDSRYHSLSLCFCTLFESVYSRVWL